MKVRAIVLAASLAAVHTASNAWFFFIIPGSVVSKVGDKLTGVDGEHCVGHSAKVGDTIRVDNGATWKVQGLYGTSSRCNTAQFPVRAKLERLYTDAELHAEHVACIPLGQSPGNRIHVRSMSREMEVVRLTGTQDCSTDASNPVQAVLKLPSDSLRLVTPAPAAVTTPVAGSAPVPAPAAAPVPTAAAPGPEPAARNVTDRLRELKQLRDESLITQEVYEAKQRDILRDQ